MKTELLEHVQGLFPEFVEWAPTDPKFVRGNDELTVKGPAGQLATLAEYLRRSLGFDLLNFMTVVDYIKENRFEAVYHFLRSSEPRAQIFVKVDLPREGQPVLPSLTPLYAAADWQERETYDLFGIRFEGHPNLRRILLWEGYPGWPLRKDYVHTRDRFDNGNEIGLPKAAPAHP